VTRRREPWRDELGETRARCVGYVEQLSAIPKPLAMLSLGRWWQHHRFRCHVGERLCAACGCRRDGWCRRLRRGRRAQLVIGESGFRPAGTVTRPRSVFVAERSHAVPQRAWQHARRTASLRRRRTLSVKFRATLRAPGRSFGASVAHRPKRIMLRCETNRHAPRSGGIRSLLSGMVCGDRAVAATPRQGSERTSHRPGFPGCGSEAMTLRFR